MEGIEPPIAVLETAVIPLNYTPIKSAGKERPLLRFRLQSVLTAHLAVFLERKLLFHLLLVALRIARDLLAFATAQLHQHFFDNTHNIVLKIFQISNLSQTQSR